MEELKCDFAEVAESAQAEAMGIGGGGGDAACEEPRSVAAVPPRRTQSAPAEVAGDGKHHAAMHRSACEQLKRKESELARVKKRFTLQIQALQSQLDSERGARARAAAETERYRRMLVEAGIHFG